MNTANIVQFIVMVFTTMGTGLHLLYGSPYEILKIGPLYMRFKKAKKVSFIWGGLTIVAVSSCLLIGEYFNLNSNYFGILYLYLIVLGFFFLLYITETR